MAGTLHLPDLYPLLVSFRTQAKQCLIIRRSLHRLFHSRSAYRQSFSRSSQALSSLEFGFDPYTYTSGRWLRQDELERSSRYIRFNFEALCQKVIGLFTDSKTITDFRKIEGGFNRVFIFSLDSKRRVVARLPFPMAGPAGLTTSSEVATIRYRKLTISFCREEDSDAPIQCRQGLVFQSLRLSIGIPMLSELTILLAPSTSSWSMRLAYHYSPNGHR